MSKTERTYSENFWQSYWNRPAWAAEATPEEWFSWYIVSGTQKKNMSRNILPPPAV